MDSFVVRDYSSYGLALLDELAKNSNTQPYNIQTEDIISIDVISGALSEIDNTNEMVSSLIDNELSNAKLSANEGLEVDNNPIDINKIGTYLQAINDSLNRYKSALTNSANTLGDFDNKVYQDKLKFYNSYIKKRNEMEAAYNSYVEANTDDPDVESNALSKYPYKKYSAYPTYKPDGKYGVEYCIYTGTILGLSEFSFPTYTGFSTNLSGRSDKILGVDYGYIQDQISGTNIESIDNDSDIMTSNQQNKTVVSNSDNFTSSQFRHEIEPKLGAGSDLVSAIRNETELPEYVQIKDGEHIYIQNKLYDHKYYESGYYKLEDGVYYKLDDNLKKGKKCFSVDDLNNKYAVWYSNDGPKIIK